jgi:hypothetical protein
MGDGAGGRTDSMNIKGLLCLIDDGIFYKNEMTLDRWPHSWREMRPGTWSLYLTFRNIEAANLLMCFSPTSFGVIDDFGNFVEVK